MTRRQSIAGALSSILLGLELKFRTPEVVVNYVTFGPSSTLTAEKLEEIYRRLVAESQKAWEDRHRNVYYTLAGIKDNPYSEESLGKRLASLGDPRDFDGRK